MRYYSDFWISYAAGLFQFSAAWAGRDSEALLLDFWDDEPMLTWLRRSDVEHQAILDLYTGIQRRPHLHGPLEVTVPTLVSAPDQL